MAGFTAATALSRLRFLAHQSQLLPHPSWVFIGDFVSELRMVSLGIGILRIQSAHPARSNISAGLLGSHRTRLRSLLHYAQAHPDDRKGYRGPLRDHLNDARPFACAHRNQSSRHRVVDFFAYTRPGMTSKLRPTFFGRFVSEVLCPLRTF